MHEPAVLVIDCGATNVRAVGIDARGRTLAQSSEPNAPVQQKRAAKGWLVWDLEALWAAIGRCARRVARKVGPDRLKAVTVTTWGADGTLVDEKGRPTYPLIAWRCERTAEVARRLADRIGRRRLFDVAGYPIIHFNTLFRMAWLAEHAPEAVERAAAFLMTPGLAGLRLTGRRSIDPTIASTGMAMDLKRRNWSDDLLAAAGFPRRLLADWVEPGQVIGPLTRAAARATGLKAGTPVVAAGHDTQFAIVGSGVAPGEVVVSSGTWEILIARSAAFSPNDASFEGGLLWECDAQAGLWDPQLLMMGSGVLEWVAARWFGDLKGRACRYQAMIGEAAQVPPGAGGVAVLPSFTGTGPSARHGTKGTILGLTLNTTRGQVYRAALEGLAMQLADAIGVFRAGPGIEARALRVVGGGAKNRLWNQVRADVTGLEVIVPAEAEATALGAAIVALAGAGVYGSIDEARAAIDFGETRVEPSADAAKYADLYTAWKGLAPALAPFYTGGPRLHH
jgi:L-fuculokinase